MLYFVKYFKIPDIFLWGSFWGELHTSCHAFECLLTLSHSLKTVLNSLHSRVVFFILHNACVFLLTDNPHFYDKNKMSLDLLIKSINANKIVMFVFMLCLSSRWIVSWWVANLYRNRLLLNCWGIKGFEAGGIYRRGSFEEWTNQGTAITCDV